jgi:multicomponent Na+:H+ antiporter subunit C
VLTAIVIGLGVTAVMLSFAVLIYKTRGTLRIDRLTEAKG